MAGCWWERGRKRERKAGGRDGGKWGEEGDQEGGKQEQGGEGEVRKEEKAREKVWQGWSAIRYQQLTDI